MFDELVEIICNYVDVQPADVHEESRFMEDLGFTSFDFMSMLGEIEDTFDVEIEQTNRRQRTGRDHGRHGSRHPGGR